MTIAEKRRRLIAPSRHQPPTMTTRATLAMFAEYARQYGVPVAAISGGCQIQPLPEIRAKIAKVLRAKGYTLTRIGRILGKHHTSVYYMIHREEGFKPPSPKPFDPDSPDLSGEWI